MPLHEFIATYDICHPTFQYPIAKQIEEGTGDDDEGGGGGKTSWLLDVGGAAEADWRGFLKDSEEGAAAAAAVSPLSPMSRVKKRSLVNKLDELQSRGRSE